MERIIDRVVIFPEAGKNFKQQLKDCIRQLHRYKTKQNAFILQESFFIKASDVMDYDQKHSDIFNYLEREYRQIPSTGIIAQRPVAYDVTLELVMLYDYEHQCNVMYRKRGDIPYTVIESNGVKELYAGGIVSRKWDDALADRIYFSFHLMKEILDKESLSFNNIIRQWNYLEDILGKHEYNNTFLQNYQLLNDIRTTFYQESEFLKGYPSATGIGMDSGGFILEFYAVSFSDKVDIFPVKNREQTDAYAYSERVLVGSAFDKMQHHKTTPKFERAKYITLNKQQTIYISGTASIKNEQTIGEDNIRIQTRTTIENIRNLISYENLVKSNIFLNSFGVIYDFIRVYVKNTKDIDTVKEICSQYYSTMPVHYLYADICRDNLLVEIEGVASCKVL